MSDSDKAPLTPEQQRLIETFVVRRTAARKNWNLHAVVALVPFCLFMWGVQTNRDSAIIPAFVLFVIVGAHGYWRVRQTRCCPNCNGVVQPRLEFPYLRCEHCGARLSVGILDQV